MGVSKHFTYVPQDCVSHIALVGILSVNCITTFKVLNQTSKTQSMRNPMQSMMVGNGFRFVVVHLRWTPHNTPRKSQGLTRQILCGLCAGKCHLSPHHELDWGFLQNLFGFLPNKRKY